MIQCSKQCASQIEGICSLETTYLNSLDLQFDSIVSRDHCIFMKTTNNNHILQNVKKIEFYHYL